MNNKNKSHKKIVLLLSLFAFAMLLFGYALVPLYNVLCQALGINGKTNTTSIKNTALVDRSRNVSMQFLATNNAQLPWTFYPNIKKITLHPGENTKLTYYAKNNSNQTMTVQAVPSVTPGLAAAHLKKTECFCFRQQTLKPHQSMDMPIIFHLDNTLPKNIHEVTLSYTLFAIHKKKNKIHQKKNQKIKFSSR